MEYCSHIHSKYRGIKGFITTYNYALKYRYMVTQKALHKMKVLAFWEKYGLEAAMEAFGVKRRMLFYWKSALKKGGNKIESLNDKSKAPKTKRTRLWPEEVMTEIKRLRAKYPNLGKDKLYPELQEYCLKEGL